MPLERIACCIVLFISVGYIYTPQRELEGIMCPETRRPTLLPTHSKRLGGYAKFFAQEFRSEVCAIGPDKSAQFRMQTEASELLDVAQWLEDRTGQFMRQVDVALSAIAESNPDFEACEIMRVDYSGHHENYSRGSIFGSDC